MAADKLLRCTVSAEANALQRDIIFVDDFYEGSPIGSTDVTVPGLTPRTDKSTTIRWFSLGDELSQEHVQ